MRCIDCNTQSVIRATTNSQKTIPFSNYYSLRTGAEEDCERNQIAQPEPYSNKVPENCQSQMSSY